MRRLQVLGGDFGVRGEDFVIAIGSSSCGDTSESHFKKKVGFGEVKGSHWDCLHPLTTTQR